MRILLICLHIIKNAGLRQGRNFDMDLLTSLPSSIVLSSVYPSLCDNPIPDYRDHPF